MGSDEDKAFVLGAMLLRLIEYRQAAGLSGSELRHVKLVEEAHRLLAAAPKDLPSEEANPRGEAVETFCNMLAEIPAVEGHPAAGCQVALAPSHGPLPACPGCEAGECDSRSRIASS